MLSKPHLGSRFRAKASALDITTVLNSAEKVPANRAKEVEASEAKDLDTMALPIIWTILYVQFERVS